MPLGSVTCMYFMLLRGSLFSLGEWRGVSFGCVTTILLLSTGRVNFEPSCQATDCILVTTSSRLPKKVKDWLEMSRDQHWPIRKGYLRRRGVDMTCALCCLLDLFPHFLLVMPWCRFALWFRPLWIRWSLPGCGRTRHRR